MSRKLTPRDIILDMLSHGIPLGLHTLKACVLEPDKPHVEPALVAMVEAGLVVEVKKHRYQIVRTNGKHQ